MSGFDITGINFGNQPDTFKVDIDLDKITAKTSNTLKQADINIEDGISKQEAENLIAELNTDENLIIDDDEINAFASNKGLEGKEGEIKFLVENIIEEAKKTNTEENNENKTEDKKITVQKWGSQAVDGNKYANDCLSRIMANNYPDLKPDTQEWQDKMLEIMNANPQIYGTVDSEGNVTGARKTVGGEGRHNAVLYENDEILLPGISTPKTEKSEEDEDIKDDNSEEDNTDENAGTEPAGEVTTREDGTTDTVYKNDNNLETKTEHRDASGNLLDSTEYEYYDNGTKKKETRSIFDENGKVKEGTTFVYTEDGFKSVENTYKYKDGSDTPYPVTEKVFNSDGSYQARTYKEDGKFISAIYNADGSIQSGTEKYYDDMGNEITKEVYEK